MKSRPRTRGRKYPRRAAWIAVRDKIFARAGERCEITGASLLSVLPHDDFKMVWRRAVDHLISERFVRMFIGKGANPHVEENLYCISSSLHGRKLQVERSLYRGDWLSFKQGMIRLGWTEEQLDRAFAALCRSAKR